MVKHCTKVNQNNNNKTNENYGKCIELPWEKQGTAANWQCKSTVNFYKVMMGQQNSKHHTSNSATGISWYWILYQQMPKGFGGCVVLLTCRDWFVMSEWGKGLCGRGFILFLWDWENHKITQRITEYCISKYQSCIHQSFFIFSICITCLENIHVHW